MQLIYFADSFEDSYNIVRDCFDSESVVNVMKYMSLVAKKQENCNILAWLSLSDNHENCH